MKPEVGRLFEAALDVAPDQRAGYVNDHCADPEVRHEVLSLLAHDAQAEGFFGDAVRSAAASVEETLYLPAGTTVGHYRVISLLGRGGMGAVYLAERADGIFDQRAAIKLVSAGAPVNRQALIQRLEQERRILAQLTHPNIARLYDGGQTAVGVPYFVMEYVSGVAIDAYCSSRNLPLQDRLAPFLKVCDAVQYAHRNLIVHRDLKPANLLVTSEGEPKLLDFGIAKIIGPQQNGAGLSTRALTPEYASPEQVRGDPITTATDVYSLGAVLYRLVTDRVPHVLDGLSPLDSVRTIAEQDAPPASSVAPGVPKDVDAILAKALHKDPDRRYRTVDEFAADIRRYLEGRPVLASPDSLFYRAGKFWRRNWILCTAAVAALAIVGGAATAAVVQGRRADRRFADLRRLSNTFLFDFEASIRPLAGSTKPRQLVVDTALTYLSSLATDSANDPSLTRELAAAYIKVGDIQGDTGGPNLGDIAGALRSFTKARELLESVGDSRATDPARLRLYMSALGKITTVHMWSTDLQKALESSHQHVALAMRLRELDPGNAESIAETASALGKLSDIQSRANDLSKAKANREQATELLRAEVIRHPSLRPALASSLSQLGSIYEKTRDYPRSIGALREAVKASEDVLRAAPQSVPNRRQLMISCSRLSSVLVAPKQVSFEAREEALELALRAYTIARELSAADPYNARGFSDLMATAARYGTTLYAAENHKEAIKVYRTAIQHAEEHVRRDANDQEARLNRAIARGQLGGALTASGELQEAIQQRRMANSEHLTLAAASPDDSRIAVAQVWNLLSLGRLMRRTGDLASARRCVSEGSTIAARFVQADPANRAMKTYLDDLRLMEADLAKNSSAIR